MTTYLVAGALAAIAFCLFDWRRGLLLCLVVGFAQDPIRKLLPDRPVAMVMAVAVCFAACLAGLYLRGGRLGLQRLFQWYPRVQPAALLFVFVVIAQSAVTLARTGNPVLAGIGLISYLSPFVALLLAERYSVDFDRLRRWQRWYLGGAAIAGGTVLLQYLGWSSRLFESVAFEWVHGASGAVRMLNGLMRTSEIAAWHCAAGACLLSAYALGARRAKLRWLGAFVVLVLVVAVFLTGRRKMFAAILLFALLFLILVAQYRRGGSRPLQFLAVGSVVGLFALQLGATGGESGVLGVYLERGITVFSEAGERLETMTVGMIGNIVRRNGLLGSGAGTGGQGSQYFGGGISYVGGAAEGGVGKVLAELGLPGLVALLWLAATLVRAFVRVARLARRAPPERALPLFGLIAFLPANAAVFLTAHQIFGDPFVLIVLGLITGSILAYPRIVWREQRQLEQPERPAQAEAPVARRRAS